MMLPPGASVGILGGGQLGRMLALAAARLGYKCHIYAPDAEPPAGQVAAAVTTAAYSDEAALAKFAAAVDVITYEFENVPAETAAFLAERVAVRPGEKALDIAQDRLKEKLFARDRGVETAPFAPVDTLEDLQAGLNDVGLPAVLKTRRFGYDGKGQVRIDAAGEAEAAFGALAGAPAILEGFVEFEMELSIVAARGTDGMAACYCPVQNEHRDHILHRTIVPAPVGDDVFAAAETIAGRFLDGLDYVGVLAIELFLKPDGRLLVNEMAPRVHNSGHWTIDAATTSQFEQHIRAICGLPLGDPSALGEAEMINLIGDDAEAWAALLAEPGTHLHLYGKTESRPGRKMGHVTRLKR